MGQKVHPLGFRLGYTKDHQAKWYTNPKTYSIFIAQDRFLRQKISEKYQSMGICISSIEIERKVNEIRLTLKIAEPKGLTEKDLQKFRDSLEKQLHKYTAQQIFSQHKYAFFQDIFLEKPSQLSICLKKVANGKSDVNYLADSLVEQLELRIPFRRAIRQAIRNAQKAKVAGIKIQISGRLNGAEIARSEWVREGRVPLQTLRANIDYTYKTARTIYGLLGIKVWVFKEDPKVS